MNNRSRRALIQTVALSVVMGFSSTGFAAEGDADAVDPTANAAPQPPPPEAPATPPDPASGSSPPPPAQATAESSPPPSPDPVPESSPPPPPEPAPEIAPPPPASGETGGNDYQEVEHTPAEESTKPLTRRDTWYIGFGLGSGWASTSFGGDSQSWSDLFDGTSSRRLSLEFEVGGALTPQLLLGGRIIAIRENAEQDGASAALQHNHYLANLTYFPLQGGEGLFLRGGLGLAVIQAELELGGLGTITDSESGFGAGFGLGYAIWLGKSFNMVVSNDIQFAAFGGDEAVGAPTSGWFDVLHLGFYWY